MEQLFSEAAVAAAKNQPILRGMVIKGSTNNDNRTQSKPSKITIFLAEFNGLK